MQNGAQNNAQVSGRLLGFVRVLVGGHVFNLAVQAVSFEKDGDRVAGGFFVHDKELGIIVDEAAQGSDVQAQIEKGTAEAVRHLSQKYLN
jgi:hypothetical protein